MDFQRIAIIGISGSGKSTLSRKIAASTGLPLFHMDTLFWRGSWEEVPEKEYLALHKDLIARNQWVIEGWIDKKMKERIDRADLVVYLDYGGFFVAWRVIQRWMQHRRQSRPELPKEALERLKMSRIILALTRGERQDTEDALLGADISKVVRARSPKELNKIMKKLFPNNEKL